MEAMAFRPYRRRRRPAAGSTAPLVLLLLLLLGLVLAAATMWASMRLGPGPEPAAVSPAPSQVGRLYADGSRAEVVVGATEDDYWTLRRLAAAGDGRRLARRVRAGCGFMVEPGTGCRVLDRAGRYGPSRVERRAVCGPGRVGVARVGVGEVTAVRSRHDS